jgi:hypothetical protein
LADPLELSSLDGIVDEFELILFRSHLDLDDASSEDDKSPWIDYLNMAYPSLPAASVKSSACLICAASFSGLVRPTMKWIFKFFHV